MKAKPIHLVGHISRTFHYPILLASCGRASAQLIAYSWKDIRVRERFTLSPEKVTCKKCLHIIQRGKDRDPIYKIDKDHNCW